MIFRHKESGALMDGTVLSGPVNIGGRPVGQAGDVTFTRDGRLQLVTAAVIAADFEQFDPTAVRSLVTALEAGTATGAQLQNAVAKVIRVLVGRGLV